MLQLLPVNQLPPAVFVQESVHPLACADEGARIDSPIIAAIVAIIATITRSRFTVCRAMVGPSIVHPP